MNDEIKEILAYFEKYVKTTYMHDSEPMLNWKDLKIVLDYITNLQQENNLKTSLDESQEVVIDLQQENESWQRVATKNFNNAEDYKSRIEKAVEYIKENESVDLYDDVGSEFIRNLLNILDGRSDE